MRPSGAIAAEPMRALVRAASRRAKASKQAALQGRVPFLQHATLLSSAEQAEQTLKRLFELRPGALNRMLARSKQPVPRRCMAGALWAPLPARIAALLGSSLIAPDDRMPHLRQVSTCDAPRIGTLKNVGR